MLSEAEARLWGGLLTAIGTAVMACGLVRVFLPAADWSFYAASLAIGFGVPMLVVGGVWLKAEGERANADVWTTEARARALDVETATKKAQLSRLEPAKIVVIRDEPFMQNGVETTREVTETRPASWIDWLHADVDGLLWARLRGGDITSAYLVGPDRAFADVPSWMRWVDHLADNELASRRRNGIRTRLSLGVDECLRRVRVGSVQMPDEPAPTIAKPPLRPFSTSESFVSSELSDLTAQKG